MKTCIRRKKTFRTPKSNGVYSIFKIGLDEREPQGTIIEVINGLVQPYFKTIPHPMDGLKQ